MSRLPLLPLALVAAVVAGCGGGSSASSGSGADPAAVAPATAPLYLEAAVRPQGDVKDGAQSALRKILGTDDPGAKLIALFDDAAKDDGVSYERDVKPWLGQRVGGFVSSFGSGRGDGLAGTAIVDVTDPGKAREALVKALARHDGKPVRLTGQSYKGVGIQVASGDRTALAVLDDYALVGTLAGVKQAVDVAKGARPLTDVADFTRARGTARAADSLGFAYAQPQELLDAISAMGPASGGTKHRQALGVLRQLLAQAGRGVAVSLQAAADSVRVRSTSLGAPAQPGAAGGQAADALAGLPADAWLAVGFGDVGASLNRALAQFDGLSAAGGAPALGRALRLFGARTGIDLKRDLLSWMGSGALYARGRSLLDLGAAITFTSKDPARSRRAVGLIGRALARAGMGVSRTTVPGYDQAIAVRAAGLPVPVLIAANGRRFSAGVNPQALRDVLSPAQKLADSPQYAAAQKSLGAGMRPVLIVDTPTVVSLAETFGAASTDEWSKVRRYLDAFGPLTAGSSRTGDAAQAALAVALR